MQSPREAQPRSSRAAQPKYLISTVLAVLVTGCFGEEGVNAPPKRLTPEFVTGAAAAALQSNGRFAFDVSVVRPPGQIAEDQAKAIAGRFVREMAPYLLALWSTDHGAAIEPTSLKACDRALYAASAYEALTGDYSEITQRTWGPQWVVPMCGSEGQPQVVVSFSSQAVELASVPPSSPAPWERASIASFGIPRSASRWMYNPEQATAYAFAQTGRRIRSVPQLVAPLRPESPTLVRWRVDLEGPVSVTGRESAITRQRTTLLVGFGVQFSESGLLDLNPQAIRTTATWTDPVTKSEVRAVPSPLSPAGVEVVRRVTP